EGTDAARRLVRGGFTLRGDRERARTHGRVHPRDRRASRRFGERGRDGAGHLPRHRRGRRPQRVPLERRRHRELTESAMERVGFVGLGIMGTPMARNALKAGFAVTVTNRTIDRAKPLADAGATAVRTPRDVAERSDIVVTMVTNTPDVEAVMFGPDGIASGAHDGLLAIDMSTISPAATRDLANLP